jgi:ribokinase
VSQRSPVITIVGSFAVGITLRVPRFPVPGETLVGQDFDMGPGGKGSNQAVGTARLGAKSHLVAAIGQDSFGAMGVDLWNREGVGLEHLARLEDSYTGVGLITLDLAGNNHIVIDLGANNRLAPADVERAEALIAASDVVAAVLEIPLETAAKAMELARRHGVTALLNPAPAQPMPDAFLSYPDFLTPNESELRVLCGLAPDDPTETLTLARQLQSRGARNLIITRGSRGALIVEESGAVTEVPSVPADVVDTTGAGDAFNSGLAVALSEGKSLIEAVYYATGAGACACTRLGVIPALPTRQAVEAQMAPNSGESTSQNRGSSSLQFSA